MVSDLENMIRDRRSSMVIMVTAFLPETPCARELELASRHLQQFLLSQLSLNYGSDHIFLPQMSAPSFPLSIAFSNIYLFPVSLLAKMSERHPTSWIMCQHPFACAVLCCAVGNHHYHCSNFHRIRPEQSFRCFQLAE